MPRYSEIQKRMQSIAIGAVAYAINHGRLPSLSKNKIGCVDCKKNRAVHYDHRDYSKRLEVDPVCRGCNHARGPAIADESKYVPHHRAKPINKIITDAGISK